jgi:hypothetical protein
VTFAYDVIPYRIDGPFGQRIQGGHIRRQDNAKARFGRSLTQSRELHRFN